MPKKIKTAVIGLGWAGREHTKGYKACPGADIVAVCDMNTTLADQVARDQGVPKVYADHKEMLKTEDIGAVSVCLPNYLHAPIALDVLRAGRSVICEKPPALNARQAKQMADAAAKRKLTLMYALVRRFQGPTKLVRDYIDKREFGEVYYARAVYHRRRGIPIGAKSWFVDKERSGGGALIDIGVHALDCAWYLMGCPKPVSVSGAAYQKFKRVVPKGVKFDVDDSAFALIKFANGASMILECSWALNLPSGSIIQVAGTKGGAQFDPLTVYLERDGVQLDVTPEVPKPNPFEAEVAHFVECVLNKTKPLATAEQGVQLMAMMDAVYKSAESGREVKIK